MRIAVNALLGVALIVGLLVLPAWRMTVRLCDPALRRPEGAPAWTWQAHRALAPRLQSWATSRVASGVAGHLNRFAVPDTEWPIFTCVFYLMATENLQREWERDHPAASPDAPAVYARPALDAAVALVADPVHHTWVREHWGTNYLHRENVFFRSLLIAAFTRYETLTGDQRHHATLVDLARTLAADLDASPHGLLDDYPGECYPIDVVAAVGWIRDSDRVTGLDHRAFAQRALRAFTGRLARDGLPVFRINQHTLGLEDDTRGTGNSWSLVFAAALWPETAAQWLDAYVAHFWQETWLIKGFREYPARHRGRNWGFDVDAGPLLAGYSPAANAFAVAGLRACGRFDLAWPLSAQAIAASWPLAHGRSGTALFLSNGTHAPYLGEAALLSLFTTPPAPGMPVRTGHGAPPPIVFVVLALYLLLAALTTRELWRRIRRGRTARDAAVSCRHFRLSFILWGALLACAAALWFSGYALLALLAVLLALRSPRTHKPHNQFSHLERCENPPEGRD